MSQTVVVFGISGVGKSTACARFLEAHPSWLHFSSSEMLRDMHAQTSEQLRTAESSRIVENQQGLGVELQRRRAGEPHRPALVDAHSVIYNDKVLTPIPAEIIASLGPSGMIFLKASPELILERRLKGSRPRPRRTIDELRSEQDLALAQAQIFAQQLECSLVVVPVDDEQAFELAVESVDPVASGAAVASK